MTSRVDPDLVEDVEDTGNAQAEPGDRLLVGSTIAPAGDALVLTAGDLIVDDEGEVLLDALAAPVSLMTGSPVVEEGIAAGHLTAAGVDVTGLTYVMLENGVTIYYSGQVDFF